MIRRRLTTQTSSRLTPRAIRVLSLVALLAGAGCGNELPLDSGPSARSVPVPPGDVVVRPPRALSERPVDLARFTKDEIRRHLTVTSDDFPNGRGDLPWLVGEPDRNFSSAEFIDPERATSRLDWRKTNYWCAVLPAKVTVDLGEPAYITDIVIQPYFGLGDAFRYRAGLVLADGTRVETTPPVSGAVSRPEDVYRSTNGIPVTTSFHPRLAQKVEIEFEALKDGPDRAYIGAIRILGHPAEVPGPAPRPASAEEFAELESGSTDVARLKPEQIERRVHVSGDRAPNGSAAAPWTGAGEGYWAAAAPAWAEIILPEPSVIHRILIQPRSEKYGVSEFYAKVVDAEGNEHDTWPPAQASREPDVRSADEDVIPTPLVVDFEPVHAQRLKFYFTRPGYGNDLLYIEDIRVFGVPAAE